MIKIAVLGNKGMLGWMTELTLWSSHVFEVVGFNREDFSVGLNEDMYVKLHKKITPQFDFIINCIGAIKPRFKDPLDTALNVQINSVFPWVLAQFGEDTNTRVIHVTTDCVFDGLDGAYTENSAHNPLDAYGKSKSLGEPTNCMVLRTSIIGPETEGRSRSLVEWLKSNAGGQVNGFTNHLWNGVTTRELARLIGDIIRHGMHSHGTYHLFSNDITKYDMLKAMSDTWGLDIEVKPVEATQYCNRTLRTVKSLNSALKPFMFGEQIRRLDWAMV